MAEEGEAELRAAIIEKGHVYDDVGPVAESFVRDLASRTMFNRIELRRALAVMIRRSVSAGIAINQLEGVTRIAAERNIDVLSAAGLP